MMANQAMILCGGFGTRLGPLTRELPKPLLPVGGRPFLDYLLFELGRHGFKDVVLLASFQSEKVREYARENAVAKQFGLSLRVLKEPQQAGTGGALVNARPEAEQDFLLLNGDSWFDFNLLSLVQGREADPSSAVVMSLRHVPDAERFGVAVVENGRVIRFLERPPGPGPGLVNAGVYSMRRDVLDGLPPTCSLEQDVLPRLAREGRIAGVAREGFFIDIGVPDSYRRSQTVVPHQQRRPAVFFDRDGVLNLDHGHVGTLDRFDWVDGACDAIRACNDAGRYVFLVTNQAGVARGYYTEADVKRLHDQISAALRAKGAHIDDIRYCPYHPEAPLPAYREDHHWRKPKPGMLLDLIDRWDVDLENSCFVGDQPTDIAAGNAAGIRPLLFPGGNLKDFLTECDIL